MALTDIVFYDGDIVNFILELPAGTLGFPKDQLYSTAAVLEVKLYKNKSRMIGSGQEIKRSKNK